MNKLVRKDQITSRTWGVLETKHSMKQTLSKDAITIYFGFIFL